MEEDLGINMHGAILSLKLEGMLDYDKRLGDNYHHYKVWRLRAYRSKPILGDEE